MSLIEDVFRDDLVAIEIAISQCENLDARDHHGRTALIHAAIDDKLEIAKLLLEGGARADVQDDSGNTALHYSAQNYSPAMTSILLAHNSPIDAEDNHGNTPLGRAVFNSRRRGDVIRILLAAGADRHRANKHGVTPLDLAKRISNFDVLRFFEH